MNYRDWLQQVIYKIINPVVHGMIRIGITPNFITTTGLVLNIVAAALFVYAGVYKSGELAYVGWGGGILLPDAARLFVGLHHYIHCADRFADGELRACPCRRFGAGV